MNTPLDELINRWRESKLTDEELRRLTDALATQESRAALRRDWFLEAALPEALRTSPVLKLAEKLDPMATPRRTESKRWTSWFGRRPLTAAAAGLILGLFCASMVWTYASQRGGAVTEGGAELANASFDGVGDPLPEGMPTEFGVWSGDFARVVGSDQGIIPIDGPRMLRLLRSDSIADPASLKSSYGADMMQLVDLRPVKSVVSARVAMLELSAKANMISPQSDPYRLSVQMFTFSGRPANLHGSMTKVLKSALSFSRGLAVLDDDPLSWQEARARMLVPAEADFLLTRLTITRVTPGSAGHVEFSGHYLDDVRLTLRSTAISPLP